MAIFADFVAGHGLRYSHTGTGYLKTTKQPSLSAISFV